MKRIACCILSLLITVIVVVGAAFGLGWYAYDNYAKPYTGITYLEAWNVLFSLYGTNEQRVVTNGFNAEEEFKTLDAEFRRLLFIDEASEFTTKSFIDSMLSSVIGGNKNENGGNGESQPPEQEQTPQTEPNQNVPAAGMQDAFNSLKFDFSELKTYEGGKHLMLMTDKQLGAMLDNIVKSVASKAVTGIDLGPAVSVREVDINTDETIAANANTEIKFVVQLSLRDLIGGVLEKQAKSVAFVKGIFPKAIYATVTVKPFGEGIPVVHLNDNTAKEDEMIFKMINNIMNKSANTSGQNKLGAALDTVDGTIKKVFGTLSKYLNIAFKPQKMEANPLQALIGLMGIEDLSDEDFLYLISYMMHSIEGFENINWDKAEIDNFFAELKAKTPVDQAILINLDNFIDVLGKLGDHIDLDAIDFNKTNEEMRVNMSYDSLAAIVDKLAFKSGEDALTRVIEIRKIGMPEVENAERDQLMQITLEVKLREYMGISKMADGLMKNLLEAAIRDLQINMTVSASGVGRDVNPAIGVDVNGLGAEKTARMLSVLNKLSGKVAGGQAITEDYLIDTVQKSLIKAFDDIRSDKGAGVDLTITKDGIRIASIYEIIKDKKNVTEMEAEDIRLTLKGVVDVTGITSGIIGEFDGSGLEATAVSDSITISVSDAYLAEKAKNEIANITVSAGGTLSLEQVLLSDFTKAENKAGNKLWANETLRRIIVNNGMDNSKIMLTTVKLLLQNEVFNKPVYVSILYDITNAKTSIVINDMSADSVAKLEILISKLSGTNISFKQITDDVMNKIFGLNISITGALQSTTITTRELLNGCDISNQDPSKPGVSVLKKTKQLI